MANSITWWRKRIRSRCIHSGMALVVVNKDIERAFEDGVGREPLIATITAEGRHKGMPSNLQLEFWPNGSNCQTSMNCKTSCTFCWVPWVQSCHRFACMFSFLICFSTRCCSHRSPILSSNYPTRVGRVMISASNLCVGCITCCAHKFNIPLAQ